MDKESDQWRIECEARYVLKLHGLQRRRDYLALVERRRGAAARGELELVVKRQWDKMNGTKGRR